MFINRHIPGFFGKTLIPAFLQHKLLRRNYTSEVRSEIARYFVESTLFKAAFRDPEYQKSHSRQIAAAGRQCLQDHFFSPKNPERKQFDIDREGLTRYQRLGEITMMKRTVPNLAPIWILNSLQIQSEYCFQIPKIFCESIRGFPYFFLAVIQCVRRRRRP